MTISRHRQQKSEPLRLAFRLIGISRRLIKWFTKGSNDIASSEKQLVLAIKHFRSAIYRCQNTSTYSPMDSHATNAVSLHYIRNTPQGVLFLHLCLLMLS